MNNPRKPNISSAGSPLTAAIAFHGPSGAGKTSLATCFARPIVAMIRDQGLLPLIDAGMVPAVHHFDPIESVADLDQAINWLETAEHEYKTFVIDGLTGLEQIFVEQACSIAFQGNFDSFQAYGRGWDVVARDFGNLLLRLDRLRARKIGLVLLAHNKVANISNPSGPDYSRIVPDVKDKIWTILHKWLDVFAFLTFDTEVKAAATGKGKATGNSRRVLFTEERPSFVAKNRYGLPFRIEGDGPGAGPLFAAFAKAMREARSRSQQPEVSTALAGEPNPVTIPATPGEPSC